MLTNDEFVALARDVLLTSIRKQGLLSKKELWSESAQARAAVRTVAEFDVALDREMRRRSLTGSDLTPEEIERIQARKKIDAIKLVRERTGLSLRESKDIVDRYAATHDIQ